MAAKMEAPNCAPHFLGSVAIILCLTLAQTTQYLDNGLSHDHLASVCSHVWPKPINLAKSQLHRQGYFKQQVGYYSNHSACFSLEKIHLVNIHPNPGPSSSVGDNHTIRCLYLNARSLINKTKEFQTLATEADLISVTETWLRPEIMDCELLPGIDFTIHRRDRADRVGGGVMLVVRNTIQSLRRKDLESNAEILACELRPESKRKLLALVFYRPPNSDLAYIKEFKKSMRLASKAKFDQIIICGDFNFPHIDWSTGTATTSDAIHNHFTKTVKDNFLWQLVNFPTRINNTLDLVLSNIPDKVMNLQGFDDIFNTDHKILSFELNLKIQRKSKAKRSVYNFKKANWTELRELLVHTPWDMAFVPNNVDASLSIWCDLFISAVNEHVPKCSQKNVGDHPWIDAELLTLIKKKNSQRKKALKSESPIDLEKYKLLRRKTKQMISKKMKDHANKLRDSVFENPKRFWSFIKTSTKINQKPNFLRDGHSFVTDSVDKANLLNRFFHSVFSPPDLHPPAELGTSARGHFDHLSDIQLTVAEVAEVLRNLDPNKACGPDGIPGRLLLNVADEIAPSMCRLFNLSLSLGVMPANWKLANITAVFKKDDPTISSNYRPISLLSTVSKVLERCVLNRCYQHLVPLLYQLQHGFLKGKSTITQLLEVYHGILDSVASGKEVDAIYLDLSKAFDKVSHNLLLFKLQQYGITGPLLSWIRSYLTDRQQRVVLEGTFSDWLPVTSGVPQGSILGPLMFLVYVNDVPDYISCNSTIALFADDSKLYRAMDLPGADSLLQKDLDCLQNWSEDWAMEFNLSKCKVMHISKKKAPCATGRKYSLGSRQLECVSSITDLGITVSSDLSWARHIEDTVAKANKTLGLVKRVCWNLTDSSTRKLLYCALVRPKLEYGSNLWSPYTVKHRSLIENVQRRATKFILNYPQDMPYTERLIKLNLLPLEFRREISDLLFFFKSRNGLISTDISNYLCTFEPRYQTRNYDPNNYNLIIKHKQDYYRKSYFIRAAELWNTLPSNTKSYNSLPMFKSNLLNIYTSKRVTYSPPG